MRGAFANIVRRAVLPILFGALCAALFACTAPGLPPVINKEPHRVIPEVTTVRSGDTLYGIAWRFGVDYLDIAKLNGLAKPYTIRAGQRLRLRAPGVTAAASASARSTTTKTVSTKTTTTKSVSTTTKSASTKTKSSGRTPKKWRWPARGKLIAKFSRKGGQNGIKIAGAAGSPVRATAAGEVVYAGDGLRGYGNLIIIEHSPAYLSAYAHNQKILVREGARIRAGQKIAQMGNSGAGRVMLHFEIRKSGKPVDPLKYLQ